MLREITWNAQFPQIVRITEKGVEVSVSHEGSTCLANIPTLHLTDQTSLAEQVFGFGFVP